MTQNNGLLSNFIPKIGTTSLSLTPYCVVKCFFKKNKVHPWPPVTRPKTPPTPLAIQILNYQAIYLWVYFDDLIYFLHPAGPMASREMKP